MFYQRITEEVIRITLFGFYCDEMPLYAFSASYCRHYVNTVDATRSLISALPYAFLVLLLLWTSRTELQTFALPLL